jgi:hypothetical protein
MSMLHGWIWQHHLIYMNSFSLQKRRRKISSACSNSNPAINPDDKVHNCKVVYGDDDIGKQVSNMNDTSMTQLDRDEHLKTCKFGYTLSSFVNGTLYMVIVGWE